MMAGDTIFDEYSKAKYFIIQYDFVHEYANASITSIGKIEKMFGFIPMYSQYDLHYGSITKAPAKEFEIRGVKNGETRMVRMLLMERV